MKGFSVIALIFIGVCLLINPFVGQDSKTNNLIQNRLTKDFEYYDKYVQEHPIQDETNRQDYSQERTNFKNLAEDFNKTSIENTPAIDFAVNISEVVVGLLYIVAGIVLMMNLKWVTPMMGTVFLGLVIFAVLYYFFSNSNNDLLFKIAKEEYKLNYLIGQFNGDYYQATIDFKNRIADKLNSGLTFFIIICLAIPTTYLVKAFLQEEK